MGLKVAIPNTQASTFTGGSITGATTFDDAVTINGNTGIGTATAGGPLDVRVASLGGNQYPNIILSEDATHYWTFSAVNVATDPDLFFIPNSKAFTAAILTLSAGGNAVLSGYLLSDVLVEPNTAGSGAPNVLTAAESGTVLTNEGATAENYHTLPAAAAGLRFTLINQDAQGCRFTAAGGDTIQVADKVTAAAGYVSSTAIGSTITLTAINGTEWFATAITGTWTDGTFTWSDAGLTSP